ncbi:hypothetical protein ACFV0Q_41785, partial [Streptomyces sp. NPDC059564]
YTLGIVLVAATNALHVGVALFVLGDQLAVPLVSVIWSVRGALRTPVPGPSPLPPSAAGSS